jgi:hypothetical protein
MAGTRINVTGSFSPAVTPPPKRGVVTSMMYVELALADGNFCARKLSGNAGALRFKISISKKNSTMETLESAEKSFRIQSNVSDTCLQEQKYWLAVR